VQAEFAASVSAERGRLKAAVQEIEAFHARLMAYRDALITEVVTGQLDISHISDSRAQEALAAAREGQQPEVLA
jgi:hypothetical protein